MGLLEKRPSRECVISRMSVFSTVYGLCGLDGSLVKPKEIRNWSKDDAL